MSVAVLERLEERAGPSDADREQWLAERRTGITATEVRDLYLRKISVRELVDRKLGRVPDVGDLSHIPVIGWGKFREPHIAAIVEQRFGIRPESRVFRAADEPRFLASPDGVGVNFDEMLQVCEIKTAGKNVAPWTDSYAEKGYEIQQQWVMRVLGAQRSLFAWEKRETLPDGQFVNGELQFEWVARNDLLIEKLEALARRFLKALDKAAAEPVPEAEPIDEVLDTHAVNYLRALDLEREAKALKAPAWAALLAAGKSQTSALARITYNPGTELEVEDVDFEAAKAANATLHARLELAHAALRDAEAAWSEHCEAFKTTKTVTGKPILRVTPVKQKEQGHGIDED